MKRVNIYKLIIIVGVIYVAHHYYSHHYLAKGVSAEKQRRQRLTESMVLFQKSKENPEWYRIAGETVIEVVAAMSDGAIRTYKEVRK